MKKWDQVDLNTWVVQADNLLTTELDGETVMMSLAQAAYFGFDGTAQRIWRLIAQPIQVAAVCETLLSEYKIDEESCQTQVCAFLNELHLEGLVRILDTPV